MSSPMNDEITMESLTSDWQDSVKTSAESQVSYSHSDSSSLLLDEELAFYADLAMASPSQIYENDKSMDQTPQNHVRVGCKLIKNIRRSKDSYQSVKAKFMVPLKRKQCMKKETVRQKVVTRLAKLAKMLLRRTHCKLPCLDINGSAYWRVHESILAFPQAYEDLINIKKRNIKEIRRAMSKPEIQGIWKDYVQCYFADMTNDKWIEQLINLFKGACCGNSTHSGNCIKIWRELEYWLTNQLFEDLFGY